MSAPAVQTKPVVADVSYYPQAPDPYSAERCRLDLYTPATRGFATVVFFHGGGLIENTRQSCLSVVPPLLSAGIAVAIPDYRLSPKAKCPAYIEDAAASVAWVMENVQQHGGDPRRVFLSGHSAGGYLALMVGLDARYLGVYGRRPEQVAGLIPISGQTITHSAIREERGIPREQPLLDAFAPLHHVRTPGPAVLCIAGSEDMPCRVEENAYFVAARKAAGFANTRLMVVPGRTHSSVFDLIGEPADPVAEALTSFVRQHI